MVRNGWVVLRQRGSHIIYRKGDITYPVPYHGSKEMGKGLQKKMMREMGLDD
ncbi:MAG: type II toxin-antitoxin system HicA family toxin [Bacteroidales bacterium]|nr:type II toxin-antitoxin system HicA family toxin [Bacteroidales bacterium]